jgi:hypothetical protein
MAEDTTEDPTKDPTEPAAEAPAPSETPEASEIPEAAEAPEPSEVPEAPEAETVEGPETPSGAAASTETEIAADTESAAPPKPKRSIKTRTLFVSALVLGVIGGVAAGYTIQALRKPTPLPSLAVAQPVYPRSPIYDGTRPPGLPASQDDATTVDGDLTKLLLPTPAGAQATFLDHQWVEISQDAADCNKPDDCFTSALTNHLARIAGTTWTRSDGLFVDIRMYQYQPGYSGTADSELRAAQGHSGALSLPDSVSAAGYEFVDSNGDNDDFAVALHGDLAVYFWVTSSSHVPDPSIISNLITQQMARL